MPVRPGTPMPRARAEARVQSPVTPGAAAIGPDQRALILGQLSGSLLHEFNNILTVITGTIDMLAESVADRPELSGVVRMIDEAALRGARLTSQFLGFDRGSPAQPRQTDVAALLADIARLLRPLLGRGTEVILAEAGGPVIVTVDPGLLVIGLLDLAVAIRPRLGEGSSMHLSAHARPPLGQAIADDDRSEPRCATIRIDVEHRRPVAPDRMPAAGAFVMVAELLRQAGASLSVVEDDARGSTIVIGLQECAPVG